MGFTIGLFDSGLGGLTILKHLQETFENVNFIYVADYKYNPYGTKDFAVIKKRVREIANYLLDRCNLLVIACNTASIHIGEIKTNKKVYGVIEPTANYAISQTKGHIGVLATNKTIEDGMYERLIRGKNIKVTNVKASEFVEIIENNKINEVESFKIYQEKMNKVKDVDTIILGCTHFELILPHLKKIDNTKKMITSGRPISDLIKKDITKNNDSSKTSIYVTKENKNFVNMLKVLNIKYDYFSIVNI